MTQPVKWFASDMAGAPTSTGQVGQVLAILDACLVNGFNLLTLDSLVVASNVATGTKATHGYKRHQIVTIAGASPAGLNGEWRVTGVATNTFTFTTTGISDQTATGTITAKAAPAGWLKPYNGTNKGAYRSQHVASSQIFMRVDDSVALYATATGYETMSDINTGTNSFGPHYFKKSSTADATARAWILIADELGFYFGVQWTSSGNYDFYHFGDFKSIVAADAYSCRLQGLLNSAPATLGQYSSVSDAHPGSGGVSPGYVNYSVTPRAYSAIYQPTALLQASMSGALSVQYVSSSGENGPWNVSGNHGYSTFQNTDPYTSPNPGDAGLHFFPVYLVEPIFAGAGKMLRGTCRGILHVYESLPTVAGQYQIMTGVSDVTEGMVLMVRSAAHTPVTYPSSVLAFELGDWG